MSTSNALKSDDNLAFEPAAPAGAQLRARAPVAGDAASVESTARLKAALSDLKQQAVRPLLDQALEFIRGGDWKAGGEWAMKALQVDERSGFAWWVLAICREKAGDFRNAITCYESAIALLPDQAAIANDLGRLAFQMGQKDVAEKLFAHYLVRNPGHPEAANNLACALRDQQRFDEAIETLRTVIYAHPEVPLLWNTLGTVLNEQGDIAESITFYDEALRLDPRFARARYNRGNARSSTGDVQGALEDVEGALAQDPPEPDASLMRIAQALNTIACGEVGKGWDLYETRLDPRYPDVTRFLIDRPRWQPDSDVEGKTVLVVGEQGLGDEILFANTLPDLIEALGPRGKLYLAVERRQVKLFQQSFPTALVGAHATYKVNGHMVRTLPFLETLENGAEAIDFWTPMGSLLRRFRRRVDAFPFRERFLSADPQRIEHWRGVLANLGDGPKVGVLWKSLKQDSARRRFYSPFDQWRPVLTVPGVRFVNLQYGDCSAELEQARAAGLDLWNPKGIDLKDDLDEVAALTCALDLTIGPMTATANIAAACGANVWLISTPGAWTRMGEDRFPWYPLARTFVAPALNQWEPVMAETARALKTAF